MNVNSILLPVTHYPQEHSTDFHLVCLCRVVVEGFGDLDSRIHDVEVRFISELQEKVETFIPQLLSLSTRVYNVDCYISLAKAARDLSLVRPQLHDSPLLHIVQGRHLLHGMMQSSGGANQFIPNDTALGEVDREGGEIHLITGPNGVSYTCFLTHRVPPYPHLTGRRMLLCMQSGKSVYLQQVGLIAYLALCGSFVPAQSATIGLLDAVYSSLPDGDSTASDMSSFCQEASHTAFMYQHATPRSLCLLDEFGKGTDSDDGVALLTAYLSAWAQSPTTCPLVLATTHFHDIATYDLLPRSPRIRPYTMAFERLSTPPSFADSALSADAPSASATASIPYIAPMFNLVCGTCTSSYALSCARSAGLPLPLLERAAALHAAFESGTRVQAWSGLMDDRRRKEEESDCRIVCAFERCMDAGLERLQGTQLRTLIEFMRTEDEWITQELRMEAEVEADAAQ